MDSYTTQEDILCTLLDNMDALQKEKEDSWDNSDMKLQLIRNLGTDKYKLFEKVFEHYLEGDEKGKYDCSDNCINCNLKYFTIEDPRNQEKTYDRYPWGRGTQIVKKDYQWITFCSKRCANTYKDRRKHLSVTVDYEYNQHLKKKDD